MVQQGKASNMNHLQKYLVDEFVEDYQEGHLTRREALKRIAGITGMAAAIQLLAACGQPATPAAPAATAAPAPTEAPAATAIPIADGSVNVAADDPAIIAEAVEFPGSDATLCGYLARPVSGEPAPVVLVCHENRGLTPHIEDVTRRLARLGYVALAVDLLSRDGGFARISDPASIPGLLSGAPPARHGQDFASGLAFLKNQPYAQADRAGMVGFCFGGGVTWITAATIPELRAAVPFYGPPVPVEQVPSINAAVLAIYAENDQRINQRIPTIEAAMQAAGKTYQKIIYPGVDHAFHNDTGTRYNAEAAKAAWAETITWFERYLKA
jgi:carboxymethylenebutenolidase